MTVTLTVDPPPPPVLSVTPATLAFTATVGGTDPAAKTVAVSNTGTGSMSWTASENATWLSVSPASGTNARHGDGDADDRRPGRRHLHDRRHVHGAGRDRLAQDGHRRR